jgi:hypothetical protein
MYERAASRRSSGFSSKRAHVSFLPIYDAARHVLVELDPGNVVDSQGSDARVPCDLRGISGSAIWHAFSYGEDAATWTPSVARVVAIETSVVRNEGRTIVRGTRWFVVLALLRHACPDLAAAIDLHQPSPATLRLRG